MVDILNITGKPIFDDRIVKIETHTYNPYANTTFGHSDEIRIPIQQQDLYTLPCDSFLYVEGKLMVKKKNDQMSSTLGNCRYNGASISLLYFVTWTNNCMAFMFDEIRNELNGVEIDSNRNVGITSTIKNYVSMTYDKALIALNAGWNSRSDMEEGYFNFCVPLNMLLGFCEDYKRVVVNARLELILIRARNDYNCLVGNPATEPEVELFKMQWRMPHVSLNDINKFSMLRALESGRYLSMSFRSWDLYEYPLLQNTNKHSWAVKTATQLEKPRYVIIALQIGRKNVMSQDISKGPFAVIDCSRQNESVKSATVDVRIEFDCKENVPAYTTAYCLIIHDRVIKYCPLSNVVRKIM
ncbi:hypothetical protein ALC57_14653 [Trachymyrmex cornetzi]|uniref:Double jelly roll-like domain-containing protein n=1 Tax=Trachymyrmex cornetzi TaxID=471704 RepID=A0A151IXX9_9HYME|nr:hypothetical protein ALC57_14653 [Trachymyrmex cornetzi]